MLLSTRSFSPDLSLLLFYSPIQCVVSLCLVCQSDQSCDSDSSMHDGNMYEFIYGSQVSLIDQIVVSRGDSWSGVERGAILIGAGGIDRGGR